MTPSGPIERTVTVRSVQQFEQPDHWNTGNESRTALESARVEIDVDGVAATIQIRRFELPVTVNGLRVYGELTYDWAHDVELIEITDLERDVRLSFTAAEEPWAPPDLGPRPPVARCPELIAIYVNSLRVVTRPMAEQSAPHYAYCQQHLVTLGDDSPWLPWRAYCVQRGREVVEVYRITLPDEATEPAPPSEDDS